MLLLMPKTLPRYPRPCRYPKPCPATRSLAPLRSLAATRSLPLPETSLALYPKPCPATRSLAATQDLAPPLPEPLPRYRKPCQNPCPATGSLARTLAPLPEALPEPLPRYRYPKPCQNPCPATGSLARNLTPLPEALLLLLLVLVLLLVLEPSLSEDRQMFTWNPPPLQPSKSSSEDLPHESAPHRKVPWQAKSCKNQRDIRAKTHAKRMQEKHVMPKSRRGHRPGA